MTATNPPLLPQTGQWLIVSDLDGTLLDHYTYSHDTVDNVLLCLDERAIPVILNSSKTRDEMISLREDLHNRHPFIVENGSAIYIPADYFPQVPNNALPWQEYFLITLGAPRETILQFLQQDAERFGAPYASFSNATVAKIVELTGLAHSSAQQASQRHFSEPLVWQGNDVELRQFQQRVADAGFNTLQGGRFLHVLGQSDKGKATGYLRDEYQRQYGETYHLLAAGDSQNDLDMLAMADIAVIIRSPTHAPPHLPQHGAVFVSNKIGPDGWAEIISPLLAS